MSFKAPTSPDSARRVTPRRVLVIAYYFPPMGMSGVQRVARFVKYLPDYGWEPVVLTAVPRGYFAYDASLMREMEDAGIRVSRTSSFDPTRFFRRGQSVSLPPEARRKTLSAISQFFFVPDNKIGWYASAVREGKKLLEECPFDAIFSSAPPYTAHLVARSLSKASGLPLVSDFRDDWVGNPRHVYPTPVHRAINLRLERDVLQYASAVTTINEPIRDGLLERHPAFSAANAHVVTHGFDPADFAQAPIDRDRTKMRLVYSGVFYDAQRPDEFLEAMARWFERRPEARRKVEAVFVGMVPDYAKTMVKELKIEEEIRFAGYLPHDAAVRHLMAADVLWMTVGRREGSEGISTSKLFEYFGSGKPILGLVPPGAARDALLQYGAARVTDPDDIPEIVRSLDGMFEQWRGGTFPKPDPGVVRRFDRKRLAGDLAGILESCLRAANVDAVMTSGGTA